MFLLPSKPVGAFLHTRGGITGKRERESECEGSGEEDPSSCSVHKMQRQSAEVSFTLSDFKVQGLSFTAHYTHTGINKHFNIFCLLKTCIWIKIQLKYVLIN